MSRPPGQSAAPLLGGVALTAAAAAAAYALLLPQRCSGVAACAAAHGAVPRGFNAYVACAMAMASLYEVASLICTCCNVRDARAFVPEIKSKCLPSVLLVMMFAVLVVQHSIFASSPSAWYAHAVPATEGSPISHRPVCTLSFIEWLLVVPLMMVASGYCALGRPMGEVVGPVALTNTYIVLAWVAFLSPSAWLRWSLVAVTMGMYTWASHDMVKWISAYYRTVPADLPSRNIRPCLTLGLIGLFAAYAVVYLSAVTGALSPQGERVCQGCLSALAKVALSISFVAIRASEYHQTLTGLLKKMSTSNAAMVSILRGSFDMLLPCTIDASGCCLLPSAVSADVAKLEASLGRPVRGLALGELLADGEERRRFSAYVLNTLRQAELPQRPGGGAAAAAAASPGGWSGRSVAPVAQVLNCKMAPGGAAGPWRGAPAAGGRSLDAVVHLSVVPHSSLPPFGREVRHVMAALRLGAEEAAEPAPSGEALAPRPRFEAFDAEAAELLAEADAAAAAESEAGGGEGGVIVASLADMAKLGMSAVLCYGGGSSLAGSETYVASTVLEAMASASDGPQAPPSGLPKMTWVEGQVSMSLGGSWVGSVSRCLGGHAQTMRFSHEGAKVEVGLLGVTLQGTYRLNCDAEPHQMDLHVQPREGSRLRPAPIRCIFKLEEGALTLCGPSGEDERRPGHFEGPGLCTMLRAAAPCAGTAASTRSGSSSSMSEVPKGAASGAESFERSRSSGSMSEAASGSTMELEGETERSQSSEEAQQLPLRDEPRERPGHVECQHLSPDVGARADARAAEFMAVQVALTAVLAVGLTCFFRFRRLAM